MRAGGEGDRGGVRGGGGGREPAIFVRILGAFVSYHTLNITWQIATGAMSQQRDSAWLKNFQKVQWTVPEPKCLKSTIISSIYLNLIIMPKSFVIKDKI